MKNFLFSTLLLISIQLSAYAEQSSELQKCATRHDDRSRLACYDALADRLNYSTQKSTRSQDNIQPDNSDGWIKRSSFSSQDEKSILKSLKQQY